MKNTATTLVRNSYGELETAHTTSAEDRAAYLAAYALVEQAAKAGKIPAAFDDMEWGRSGKERGKRIGEARHHEIYDFTASAVLVCVRSVEGTRYGQKTTDKSYFLVSKAGRGVKVTEASKAVAAKAAKAAGNTLGLAVAVCQGKRPAPAPKCLTPRTGYKIVRREAETFVSVWDDSEWALGKSRIEAATPDHEGGFYFYATLDEAITQAVKRQAFGDAREYHDLSILEVEVAGREFAHDPRGIVAQTLELPAEIKRCATRIKPIREVFAVL